MTRLQSVKVVIAVETNNGGRVLELELGEDETIAEFSARVAEEIDEATNVG